jgi:hypothetical protein
MVMMIMELENFAEAIDSSSAIELIGDDIAYGNENRLDDLLREAAEALRKAHDFAMEIYV